MTPSVPFASWPRIGWLLRGRRQVLCRTKSYRSSSPRATRLGAKRNWGARPGRTEDALSPRVEWDLLRDKVRPSGRARGGQELIEDRIRRILDSELVLASTVERVTSQPDPDRIRGYGLFYLKRLVFSLGGEAEDSIRWRSCDLCFPDSRAARPAGGFPRDRLADTTSGPPRGELAGQMSAGRGY